MGRFDPKHRGSWVPATAANERNKGASEAFMESEVPNHYYQRPRYEVKKRTILLSRDFFLRLVAIHWTCTGDGEPRISLSLQP